MCAIQSNWMTEHSVFKGDDQIILGFREGQEKRRKEKWKEA